MDLRDRAALSEPDLGKGYGSKMMALALARCFAEPSVSAVLVDPLASNVRAHRFSARLGFQFVERRRLGGDGCFVYRLDRSDYLRAARQAFPRRRRKPRPAEGRRRASG